MKPLDLCGGVIDGKCEPERTTDCSRVISHILMVDRDQVVKARSRCELKLSVLVGSLARLFVHTSINGLQNHHIATRWRTRSTVYDSAVD